MIRFFILLAVLMSTIISGCTHNNGDIGEWFGTWKVTEITIDGVTDTTYTGNMFWLFQASVICMRTMDDNHGYTDHWGSWKELPDAHLEFNFTHHDNDNEPGSWKYRPAPASRLPVAVSILNISSLSRSSATLSYTTSTTPPSTITYHLRKR